MSSKRGVDWSQIVDLGQAIKNLDIEAVGDWYRDPWGWPEHRWALTKDPEAVFNRLKATNVWSVTLIDVPKENFLTRPAIVLDPMDRIAYACIVDALSEKLIGNLSMNSFGWRLPLHEPVKGHYSKNSDEWGRFRSHLAMASDQYEAALLTDIVSCFSSIRIAAIADTVNDLGGSGVLKERLLGMLYCWEKVPNRSGIPQRSIASAVLANAFLRRLDVVLAHFSSPILGPDDEVLSVNSSARWMDDIWLFGSDVGKLRRAQVELQAEARVLGLDLNSGKTELLEGQDVRNRSLEIEHSAVDGALFASCELSPNGKWVELKHDPGPLEELLERLIIEKECASRTSVRFAATRMRRHKLFDRAQELLEVANRMPHCADHLARLFRDSINESEFQDWYLEYTRSPWSSFEWAIASFGTTLHSRSAPRKETREYYERVVSEARVELPLFALAAQRLAVWDPNRCKMAVRAAIKAKDNPHYRRISALAALGAGDSRSTVRTWLSGLRRKSFGGYQAASCVAG